MSPLSWPRRLLFITWIVLGELALLEGGAWVATRVIYGEWRSPSRVQPLRDLLLDGTARDDIHLPGTHRTKQDVVVHPYQGYVKNPKSTKRHYFEAAGFAVNDFGMIDQGSPLAPRADREAVVGIAGGSVATQFRILASDVLEQSLWRKGFFEDADTIRFVTLANGGYKQPQQLMGLQYLLSLGVSFDAIINIDGFNEIALHEADNAKKGVHPIFPRGWFLISTGASSASTLPLIRQISALSRARRAWSKPFSESPLRHLAIANLIWSVQDQRMRREIDQSQQDLLDLVVRPEQAPFAARGPLSPYKTAPERLRFLAQTWKRCSILMHQTCLANDIQYFHFLQPNQYIEPSKPMGPAERAVAINEDHPYRASAIAGYPLLQDLGAELLEHSVPFWDLTGIFADLEQALYLDDCCHLNAEGYALMAEEIARRMVDHRAP